MQQCPNSWRLAALMLVWLQAWAAAQTTYESSGGAAGTGFLMPESWGLIRSRIVNPGASDVELLNTVQFKHGQGVQFATRTWVPAAAVREIVQPVYLAQAPSTQRAVDLTSVLIDASRGEQIRGKEDGLIRLETEDHATGMVGGDDSDDAISAVVAARLSSGHSKRLAYMPAHQLPVLPAAYDSLGSLVLADTQLALNAAQVSAIRHWLVSGGHLWLMVDRLPADIGPRLLGDDWPLAIVDRLPVTQLRLRGRGVDGVFERERDEPWDLVRVAVAEGRGVEVGHEVEGWPASLSFDVGRGRVLVTTLDAAAWWTKPVAASAPAAKPAKKPATKPARNSKPEPDTDAPAADANDPVATDALAGLARQLTERAPAVPVGEGEFGTFVREQIGYRILSRGPVLAVLAVLPIGLLAAGLWLGRRGRLEMVGVVAAAGAVVLCGVLVGMGSLQRRTVPLTVASAQWVNVASDQDLAQVEATISIYSPEADRGPLRGTAGGVLWPDMTGQAGAQLRMVWTDLEHWSWEGLELPSGAVRTAQADAVLQLPEATEVVLSFDEAGVRGRIEPGPFEQMQDMVLATPIATMRVRADGEGRFAVSSDDVASGGDYIASAAALSQTQRARLGLYRTLLQGTDYPQRTTLLAWAKSLDLGHELSIPAQQHHSALVAMPVRWTAPPPGQRLTIPAAFLPYSLVRGEGNQGTTTIYNAMTRQWIGDVTQGGTMLLRFALPAELRQLEPDGATLELDLDAPDREVEVLRVSGRTLASVRTLTNPAGRRGIDLDAAELGPVDSEGGLVIGVRVSESPDAATTWRMNSIALTLRGRLPAP